MLLRLYDRARRRLGDSTAKRLLRGLGLTRPARHLYERGILKKGEMVAPVLGRSFRFRVTSPQEILSIETLYAEDEFFERMLASLRPSDVFYDIGANIGLVTLLTAREHPDCRVHSFEPEPRNADHLTENVALNALGNVTIHRLALGSAPGHAKLFVVGTTGSGLHSLVPSEEANGRSIDIPVSTGAEIAERTGERPSVMKIDVEGFEMGVLEGCERLLGRGGCREVFLEAHSHAPVSARDIQTWMEARGYAMIWSCKRVLEELQHYRLVE